MKTNILSFTVLATLLAAGCSKTEVQPQAWSSDPDAVIVDASVGAMTKSNPLGNSSEQQTFNAGDEITIAQPKVGTSVVYKFDGTSWAPSGDDYLVWSDKGKEFEAWYPSKDPAFVTDQSTGEGIAKADVMSCSTDYLSIPSDHRLKLSLYRDRSLVTVKIKGYNDEFDPAADKISDLRIYLTDAADNADRAVSPYVRDTSGAGQASDAAGTVGFSYSAIGLRASGSDANLFIEFMVGDKTLTVSGCPAIEPGKAYTFNLTVGKDRIEAGDVTIADWSEPVDINEGNEFEADMDGVVWDGTVATSFESGTGTEDDPYIIATPSQLAYLAQQVKNGTSYSGRYFKQTSDLILANMPWTPIGWDPEKQKYFNGNFDGDGKKICGLNVKSPNPSYAGLFGIVQDGSIANCTVFGRVEGKERVGGIVGAMWTGATMTNCTAEVTVKGNRSVGGLCGQLDGGSITGCSAVDCAVEGGYAAGCLVGNVSSSFNNAGINGCIASGTVIGAESVGGIFGNVGSAVKSISVSGCVVNVDLTVTTECCGGLVGYLKGKNVQFSDCGFNGIIKKDGKNVADVGAAIGLDRSAATFTNCWYNADKTGDLPLVAKTEDDAVGKEYTGIEARHLGN